VFRWVAGGRQPLLTGINILEGFDFYNGATLITPEFASLALALEGAGEPRLASYRKQHLFPFVEKVPFSDKWPWLERFRMGDPNIPQGRTPADPEPMQFAFADRKGAVRQVGGIICFELLYPGLVAAAARADVDFLVMLGNDTDLMDTVTLKHLQAQARVRAVETGRDLVRADLWGPSLVANRHGEVAAIVPEGEARILAASVRATKTASWFAHYPDVVPLGCSMLVLLFGIAAVVRPRAAQPQRPA
jgi:apolipoprotein N-acyltransferase